MSNLSTEKKEENNKKKVLGKKIDVDVAANLLIKIQNENHYTKSEFIDLKKIITKATEDIKDLREKINELKAMGARGIIGGTGSTVHKKGE